MVYDIISNIDIYSPLNPNFDVVTKFLDSNDLKTIEPGEQELENGVKAIIAEYETEDVSNKFIECHKKYIDVQVVISGEEKIGYANIDECDILEEYNEDNDFEKLSGSVDLIIFSEGYFTILFPQDGHMPGVTPTGEESRSIKKVVFKVPV